MIRLPPCFNPLLKHRNAPLLFNGLEGIFARSLTNNCRKAISIIDTLLLVVVLTRGAFIARFVQLGKFVQWKPCINKHNLKLCIALVDDINLIGEVGKDQ